MVKKTKHFHALNQEETALLLGNLALASEDLSALTQIHWKCPYAVEFFTDILLFPSLCFSSFCLAHLVCCLQDRDISVWLPRVSWECRVGLSVTPGRGSGDWQTWASRKPCWSTTRCAGIHSYRQNNQAQSFLLQAILLFHIMSVNKRLSKAQNLFPTD